MFAGDYNLPDICWSSDRNGFTYNLPVTLYVLPDNLLCAQCVSEAVAYFGFYQKNCILNSHGSLLCIVFYNTNSISVVSSTYQL